MMKMAMNKTVMVIVVVKEMTPIMVKVKKTMVMKTVIAPKWQWTKP